MSLDELAAYLRSLRSYLDQLEDDGVTDVAAEESFNRAQSEWIVRFVL